MFMKGIEKMTRLMEKESLFILMELFMKESGLMISSMAKA